MFLTNLHYTRYGVLRKSGYHLFFQSAIAGGVLVAVARPAAVFVNDNLPQISALWTHYVPFDYSGTVALSVLLGFILPYVVNLFYRLYFRDPKVPGRQIDDSRFALRRLSSRDSDV